MRDGFTGSRTLVLPQMVLAMAKNEQLCKQLYVTDMGYYPHAHYHRRERLVPIEQYVFIYCVDGCGYFWVEHDDGVRHEYKVAANQYFVLPAGCRHCYWADKSDPWTIYWVHFAGEHASAYAGEESCPLTVRPENDSRISDRHRLFEEIYDTLMRGFSKKNLIYSSVVLQHYLVSLMFVESYRGAVAHTEGTEVVGAAIHFMRENIDKRLKLAELANYTGLSVSHFSSVFRHSTGHAPLEYFNMIKIQEACRLLDYSSMRINQICHKVGIDDSYYFSRLFSKVVGMSPTEYMNREEENKNEDTTGV